MRGSNGATSVRDQGRGSASGAATPVAGDRREGVPPAESESLGEFYADLHIHLGRAGNGAQATVVKVTASARLTLERVARECKERKGIHLAGIVDAASPAVQADIDNLLEAGRLTPLPEGGLAYNQNLTLILGAEVETREKKGAKPHFVAYFPGLEEIRSFTRYLSPFVTNINLSSQAASLTARHLLEMVSECRGFLVPAHAFTPFKSVYGSQARLEGLLPPGSPLVPAVELGLSADTDLADRIGELADLAFLSNSDAHSAARIAREYNLLLLAGPNFQELLRALRREGGRCLLANYGLDPRLGKYHRTHCERCGRTARDQSPSVTTCPHCGSRRVVMGVLDRITAIADWPEPRHPPGRPPYFHQIPLDFVPGVGPRSLALLLEAFGSEMAVLHRTGKEDLASVVGEKLAETIILAREGRLRVIPGGGGRYGRSSVEV